MPLGIHAAVIDLNFDSLYPETWYQKGLASTMSVWHVIMKNLEEHNAQLPLDVILGKLVFGQFCVERMRREEQIRPEDSTYFVMVMGQIQLLLATVVVTPVMRDRADCIIEMLIKIQKTLDLSHIPADI